MAPIRQVGGGGGGRDGRCGGKHTRRLNPMAEVYYQVKARKARAKTMSNQITIHTAVRLPKGFKNLNYVISTYFYFFAARTIYI